MRLLDPSQAAPIFAAVDADRDYLREWLPWVDRSQRVEDTRVFLELQQMNQKEGTAYGYGLWRSQRIRGIVGLHDVNMADRHCKIGYWLARQEQGRGQMTRAVRALLGVCFESLNMERVEINMATGNRPSAAIPVRLGFTEEGVLRHAQLVNGRFLDLRVFSLLREEFRL